MLGMGLSVPNSIAAVISYLLGVIMLVYGVNKIVDGGDIILKRNLFWKGFWFIWLGIGCFAVCAACVHYLIFFGLKI